MTAGDPLPIAGIVNGTVVGLEIGSDGDGGLLGRDREWIVEEEDESEECSEEKEECKEVILSPGDEIGVVVFGGGLEEGDGECKA